MFIVIDELRYDEISAERQSFIQVPNIDNLSHSGVFMTQYFAVAPICSPNRASMLTGRYPAIHGVVDNTERSLLSQSLQTFATELDAAGYETGFVGKWHMGNDPSPRPGFDFWAGLPGQGRLTNPQIWENGEVHQVTGYVTDVLTERAIEFLRRPRSGPFLLYLAHKAIHPDAQQLSDSSVDFSSAMQYAAAPRHQGRFANETVTKRPSASGDLARDLKGKPAIQRALERKRSKEVVATFGPLLTLDAADETIRARAEMLLSVDESIGRVVDELRRQNVFENTLIIFTSDNGGIAGEHGLTIERRLPYEEVIRLPLIVHFPRGASVTGETNRMVLSVDIAPTMLDAAGIQPSYQMQGQSFLPLLRDPDPLNWQDAFVLEHRPDERPFPWIWDLQYVALRKGNFKLIRWLRYPRNSELYDLGEDPYEQHNVIGDSRHQARLPELESELRSLYLAQHWLEPGDR